MQAIGYTAPGPIDAENALIAFEAEKPEPGPRDVLVEIKAISVNPIDTKVRTNAPPEDGPRILGWDASGIVVGLGSEVSDFAEGDEVFYAGALLRPGSNAPFQCVDERLVAKKPANLSHQEAAAIPLTALTAWEMLFDCFHLKQGGGVGEALLVIGGAGGVGSIMIQLAKALTCLTVIGTASRPETVAWVEKMGADHVINHRNPLNEEMTKLGIAPKYVAALTQTDEHFSAIIDLIKPRGMVGVIDDPAEFDFKAGKPKSITFAWEAMFCRALFGTDDMAVQGEILAKVSALLDADKLVTTMNKDGGTMTVENMIAAHRHQESGTAIGKTVLTVAG